MTNKTAVTWGFLLDQLKSLTKGQLDLPCRIKTDYQGEFNYVYGFETNTKINATEEDPRHITGIEYNIFLLVADMGT